MKTILSILLSAFLFPFNNSQADDIYFGGQGDTNSHWVGFGVQMTSSGATNWTAYTLGSRGKIKRAPATFLSAGSNRWSAIFDEHVFSTNKTEGYGLANHKLEVLILKTGEFILIQDGSERLTLKKTSEQELNQFNFRKVLAFDVTTKDRSHKADLGNHRYIRADWGADNLGWEIEVLNYGDKYAENLLYDGNNWHGLQPWMVLARTKHEHTYPDVREATYDKGQSHIRIALVDCQTRQVGSNSYEFVRGRIEVFHNP